MVTFKNSVPFTNCISRINNMQVDDPHSIDVLMPMFNLIEYSDNYSKLLEILLEYSRDEPALANNSNITDFNEGNASS